MEAETVAMEVETVAMEVEMVAGYVVTLRAIECESIAIAIRRGDDHEQRVIRQCSEWARSRKKCALRRVPCLEHHARVALVVRLEQRFKPGPDAMLDMIGVEVEEVGTIETAYLNGLAAAFGEAARHPALPLVNKLSPKRNLGCRVDSWIGRVEYERVFPSWRGQLRDEGFVSR